MHNIVETKTNQGAGKAGELQYLESPEDYLSPRQRRWLDSPGLPGRAARAMLYGVNACGARLLFRPRLVGQENLPDKGPCIIAPNHASSLDPFVLSAALGYRRVRQTVWAGRQGALLENRARRFVNRLAHAIPIQRNTSALAVGAAALQRGRLLVWFPEGRRSDTGELQPFKRGVGALMDFFNAPAIPAYIHGAYDAMPRHRPFPKPWTKISVVFGPPVVPQQFADEPDRERRIEKMVTALRARVLSLSEAAID